MDTVRAFAGDWHANASWARHCASSPRTVQAVYHVGDFGTFAPRRRLPQPGRAECATHGITIHVTPGTTRIGLGEMRAAGPAASLLRPRIALPRNYRWTDASRSFLSLACTVHRLRW